MSIAITGTFVTTVALVGTFVTTAALVGIVDTYDPTGNALDFSTKYNSQHLYYLA